MNKQEHDIFNKAKPTITHTLELLANPRLADISRTFKYSERNMLVCISNLFVDWGYKTTIKMDCTHKCTAPDCVVVECDPNWQRECYHDAHTDNCTTYVFTVTNIV
jgi:hypothetical protein